MWGWYMHNLIWYLFAATRGGEMRAKIIDSLITKPKNANQLARDLKVDYKTIQHHLRVLYENRMMVIVNEGTYGATYFISPLMKENIITFEEIWKRFGKK